MRRFDWISPGYNVRETNEEEEEHYPAPQPQKLVLEYVTLAHVSQSRVKLTWTPRGPRGQNKGSESDKRKEF